MPGHKLLLRYGSWLILFGIFILYGCTQRENEGGGKQIEKSIFGQTPSGEKVDVYTLTNAGGMEIRAITYGGIILSIRVPDKNGVLGDIALGYDSLSAYVRETPYFGAIIGRYGNRIARGQFSLDGVDYILAQNNDANHLHGGIVGFDKVVWRAESFEKADAVGLAFSYTSVDKEEGYPGTLEVRITYTLTNNNELVFEYEASTDKATPVNLTQHTYFNLAGHDAGDILAHNLMLNADSFTPVDETLIPTGEIRSVVDTPFDFIEPAPIGARIINDSEQIRFGLGYDHNFVLNRNGADSRDLVMAARVNDPLTGRVMEVFSTEPGIQLYSGNFLDGTLIGKGGAVYAHRTGFCLETQHFPDSPNQSNFPSTILRPGERYSSRTMYSFSVQHN